MAYPELDDAIDASRQALAAIIRGDVEPFLAPYSDADDITIGNPFGPFAVGREATRAAGSRAASVAGSSPAPAPCGRLNRAARRSRVGW